jgi:putative methionine-R-sulfoxide reductase with GAF domain
VSCVRQPEVWALGVQQALDGILRRVVDIAVSFVEGSDLAGITLMRDGRPEATACSDPIAREIEQTQYEAGDGPCLTALDENRVVSIPNTTQTNPWPDFAQVAAAHGICSTISFPLTVGDRRLGALNLYSHRADAFADEGEAAAVLARQAAVVLANAQAYWAVETERMQLATALESRAVIDQAKGVIIAALRCTPDDAFGVLRVQSQHENRKLREVAADIVRQASVEPGRVRVGERVDTTTVPEDARPGAHDDDRMHVPPQPVEQLRSANNSDAPDATPEAREQL